MENGKGIGQLAAVVDDRIRERAQGGMEQTLMFDFADVLGDYSIRPNTYPAVIPLKDYTACKNAGNHHYGALPPPPPQIKPGDRVLIVWVGKQPVLVDVITRGEKIVKGP